MTHLQIALDLARNGYYVHPLVPRDKMPLSGGNGSNDATRDEDVIRAWWEATPNANVGISLDKTGLVDIAPDCPEWAARFKANGMPRTMLYTSDSAWHTLYRLPQGGPVARVCITKQYDIMSQGNAVAPGSIHPSGKTYHLHTPLIPVEDLPLAPAWAIEILQAHVKDAGASHDDADWQELPSGALLAHSRRFQALCKANDQLRMVCAGEAVTLTTKEGGKDSSTSIQRAVFVNQLLRAKYPHNEIRALAQHFSGVLESNPKWYTTDIDRLIRDYTPKGYKPESTGVIAQAPRGGRHYEITAGELLDRYHGSADCGILGIVLDWSVSEAAARLGVSSGTIKRRETELIDAGHMVREYGRVILSPDTWNIRSQPIETRQTDDLPVENTIGSQVDTPHQDAPNSPESTVCEEQAHVRNNTLPSVDPPGSYSVDCVRYDASGRVAWRLWDDTLDQVLGEYGTEAEALAAVPQPEVEPEPITLAEAVQQAFAELPRTRPDPSTGEVKGWQLTEKRIFAWLEATYPNLYTGWNPRSIAARIRRVRNDLRWAMAREVRTMPADELKGRREAVHKSIEKLERKAAAASDPAIRQSWEAQAASKRGMLALYVKETERRARWAPRVAVASGECVLSRAEGPPPRPQAQQGALL